MLEEFHRPSTTLRMTCWEGVVVPVQRHPSTLLLSMNSHRASESSLRVNSPSSTTLTLAVVDRQLQLNLNRR